MLQVNPSNAIYPFSIRCVGALGVHYGVFFVCFGFPLPPKKCFLHPQKLSASIPIHKVRLVVNVNVANVKAIHNSHYKSRFSVPLTLVLDCSCMKFNTAETIMHSTDLPEGLSKEQEDQKEYSL